GRGDRCGDVAAQRRLLSRLRVHGRAAEARVRSLRSRPRQRRARARRVLRDRVVESEGRGLRRRDAVVRPVPRRALEIGACMHTGPFASLLETLFGELVDGSPDPGGRTFVLNRGDVRLLASLERLSAAEASAGHAGGASIAAHTDHLRYGLSLLNRWAGGSPPPWPDMDWTASWKKNVVSDEQWRALRDELRREADAWAEA